jgi:hypothetical protein
LQSPTITAITRLTGLESPYLHDVGILKPVKVRKSVSEKHHHSSALSTIHLIDSLHSEVPALLYISATIQRSAANMQQA